MDRENEIVVKLLDCSEQKISEFKDQIVDSPVIAFEKAASRIATYASTVSPGCAITAIQGKSSLGYRVTRNGQVGFISTAHGIGLYDYVTIPGNQFGYCTMRQYSGTVDAVFIEDRFTASYSSTMTGTSVKLKTTVSPIMNGLNIYKSGDASGVTSGWVISSSTVITTVDNVTLRDVVANNCY